MKMFICRISKEIRFRKYGPDNTINIIIKNKLPNKINFLLSLFHKIMYLLNPLNDLKDNLAIKKAVLDTLFDEKIGGTIHLALGMAYKDNGGGNDSAIHWDIVKDMKKAKIILDNKVIQDKGKWKI